MEARVVLIRHSDGPADDRVVSFLRMCGVEPEFRHPFKGEPHEFHIPSGGEHLAASAIFPNQAVKYGESTFAFQFHAEVTPAGFRRWQADPGRYEGKQGTQEPAEQDRLGAIHDARQHDWFMGFLEQFLGQRLPAAALSA